LKTDVLIPGEKQKQKSQATDSTQRPTRSFMRKTYIDVPEIETFEWPPFN
jgi:hypothetical protein